MRSIVTDDLSSERFHSVLDDLTACNVRDVAALQQLQARANSLDTARATASSVIGFSGFSVGQISTAFIAHRFGQRSAGLATPFIGNLIFCHLSSINGDSVVAGRLGPKYDPTAAPFPVATAPHDRDVQAITADRPWILPTVTLTVTSAVALSFRLSTLPSVALSVASGLSGAALGGFYACTAGRTIANANRKIVASWLTSDHARAYITHLQQSNLCATLGYIGDVARAFRDHAPASSIAAVLSPKMYAMMIVALPFAGMGAIERAASLEQFEHTLLNRPSFGYNALKYALIGFGWGFRRETEAAISSTGFTHARVKNMIRAVFALTRRVQQRRTNQGAAPDALGEQV